MTSTRSVPAGREWHITALGRRAAEHAELCVCEMKIIGILFACPTCKTVYGQVKDAKMPRATRWINANHA